MTTAAGDPAATYVRVDELVPGPWNPRRRRDPARQAELEASVREHGVMQPILVLDRNGHGRLIIAGEGRYLAAKAAGRETIPAVLRTDLTDAQARELALLENIQRSDLHPIDEAEAFAGLMKLDRAHTVDTIAARVGKPVAYVKRRLRLLELPKEIREACLEDVITAAHAEELARVPKDLRTQAFEEGCFLDVNGPTVRQALKAKDWPTLRLELASVASLREWTDERVRARLDDEALQERLPELEAARQAAATAGKTLVEISEHWGQDKAHKLGLVWKYEIREITGPRDRCPHVEVGVVMHGGRRRLLELCRANPCPKHRPAPKPVKSASSSNASTSRKPAAKPKWQIEEEARRRRDRAYSLLKTAALRAMAPQILKAKLTAALVKNILAGYQLREISSTFGLELKTDGSNALAILLADHVAGQAYNRGRLLATGKLLGFDLAKFERARAAADKAKKKAAKGHAFSGTNRIARAAKKKAAKR